LRRLSREVEKAMELWVTHSLDKVFPDSRRPPRAVEQIALRAARNETEDAQIAVHVPRGHEVAQARYSLSDLTGPRGARIGRRNISARWIWHTYVLANPPENKDPSSYLRKAPAFFPDAFLEQETIPIRDEWTQPLWISVKVPKGTPPGEYRGEIGLELVGTNGEKWSHSVPITVSVWPFTLPDRQHLHHTEWHYPDLLAAWYHVEPWSEAHWKWLEKVAQDMAAHKQDMICTDWFDLVRVTRKADGKFTYDFSMLDRWVKMHRKVGIDWIEGGHLAHRKGAWDSPIVWHRFPVYDARGRRIDTSRLPDEKFEPYMEGLLKAVYRHLKQRGWHKQFVQHVADEPIPENEDSWCRCAAKVKEWLPGVPRIDAVMSQGLTGYVDIRVPQIQHTGPDVPRNPNETLWSYVCLAPQGQYPNRFLDYPSLRNRIIFWLSWSLGLKGFLHWGYNYWGTWRGLPEEVVVSPWTDATGGSVYITTGMPLPAGDAFLVYPGREGICSSLRWEVIRKGFEDYEYLYLLEGAAEGRSKAAAAARRLLRRVKKDLAPDPLNHTRSDADLLGARREAGDLLAKLAGERE